MGEEHRHMSPAAPRSETNLGALAALAVAGQVVLLASAWLLPFVSEYGWVGDTISELVLGRFGFVQTVAFVVAGIGTLALAYVIRRLTAGTWGSGVGPLLVGVYGVGAILAAIVPTDPIDRPEDVWARSTAGMVHAGASVVGFASMVVAMFVLLRTFLLEPRWRARTGWWLGLFPAAALSLLFAQADGPRVGLMQRLLVAAIAAWVIVVALRARAIAAASAVGAPDRSG
jgi:hypothetical protein